MSDGETAVIQSLAPGPIDGVSYPLKMVYCGRELIFLAESLKKIGKKSSFVVLF